MYCRCSKAYNYICSYHKGYKNIKVGTRIETTYETMERSKLVSLIFRGLRSFLYDLEKFINRYEKQINTEVDVFEYQKVI